MGHACVVCRQFFEAEHVYDVQGQIVCQRCYAQQPAARPPQPIYRYPCYVCTGSFTPDALYDAGGAYICHRCYAAQNEPDPLTAAVSAPVQRKKQKPAYSEASVLLLTLINLVIIAGCVSFGIYNSVHLGAFGDLGLGVFCFVLFTSLLIAVDSSSAKVPCNPNYRYHPTANGWMRWLAVCLLLWILIAPLYIFRRLSK